MGWESDWSANQKGLRAAGPVEGVIFETGSSSGATVGFEGSLETTQALDRQHDGRTAVGAFAHFPRGDVGESLM